MDHGGIGEKEMKEHICNSNVDQWHVVKFTWDQKEINRWIVSVEGATETVYINFCPFCGLHLETGEK